MVIGMHKIIFIASVVLAVMCSVYSYQNLELRTNRIDLVDEKHEFHKRWLKYENNFNLTDDIIIVTKSDKREDRNKAIEHLAYIINNDKNFKGLFYKIDKSSLSAKGFYYLKQEDL